MTGFWDDAQIIHSYSRAQAIADGVLVEVPSGIAAEAGFKIPVAMTVEVWTDCVAWSAADETRKTEGTAQSEGGRLWDVLWMAMNAARRNKGTDRVNFSLLRVPTEGRGVKARKVDLWMQCGPGDTGEPVITIMQPGQD